MCCPNWDKEANHDHPKPLWTQEETVREVQDGLTQSRKDAQVKWQRGFLSWTQNWFLCLIRLYLLMNILVPVTPIFKGLLFASMFSAHKVLLKAEKDLTMQTISFRDLPFSVLNYLLQIHWRRFLSESGPLSGWERWAAHTESAERESVSVQSAGLQLHCNSPEDTKGQSKT